MVNFARLTKKRLGEMLLEEGLITEEHINEALKRQQESGELLGVVLVKLGYTSEMEIARVLATQYALPYINAANYFITKDLVDLIPAEMLIENQIVPLDKIGNSLILAVSGHLNEKIFEEIERMTSCQLFLYVSPASQVVQALRTHYADGTAPAR
ncbi:MAG: hypothetical protein HYZ53_19195 [Planctomycetes bacterium]|nr:hypothetical protein [Planctomycetota bacterium]